MVVSRNDTYMYQSTSANLSRCHGFPYSTVVNFSHI